MYFLSITTLFFLMSFDLQGSSNVPCYSFLTECFNFVHIHCILSFNLFNLARFFGFTHLSKKQLSFYLFLFLFRFLSGAILDLGTRSSRSGGVLYCPETVAPGVFQLFAIVAMSFACVLHLISCHHVHSIIMFSKLASVPVSSFLLLSVLSPTTLARARGMSEILFYKGPRNVLGMG